MNLVATTYINRIKQPIIGVFQIPKPFHSSQLRHTSRPLFTSQQRMGEFTLSQSDPTCKVTHPDSIPKHKIIAFRAFKEWTERIRHALSLQSSPDHPFHSAPYKLRAIDIQAVDLFGGERIGFIKIQATISNDKNETLPGGIFLRGGSVAMMVRSSLIHSCTSHYIIS